MTNNIQNMEVVLYLQFAKHWGVPKDTVRYVHWVLTETGGKYGKTSRFLKRVGNLNLSPRQLKYFNRKIRLTQQYGLEEGNPNYRELISSRS